MSGAWPCRRDLPAIRSGWSNSGNGSAPTYSRMFPTDMSSLVSRRSCAGIFSKPVLDLIGEPGSSFRSEPLRLGFSEALSSGDGAGEESHPRCRHRHPDLWRFPWVQSPLPCPGDGRMFLREGYVPSPSLPGPEKAGGDLPAQGLQDASGQREDYKRPDRHALQLAPFRIPGLLRSAYISPG